MESKTEFNVRVDGEDVVIEQSNVERMNFKEARGSIKRLKQNLAALMKQESDLEKEIKEKKQEMELEKVKSNLKVMRELDDKWEAAMLPLVESLAGEIKKKVKLAKAKRGYDRIKDSNERIVMQNNILGPICEELDIDMNESVVRGVKKVFDEI